jgi:Domain of unknown function (DUF1905)
MTRTYSVDGPLWEWEATGGWFFASLSADDSAEIRDQPRERRGFGSIRVEVSIGSSVWRTSIFPDSKSGCFVFPVKKAIRAAEALVDGSAVVGSVTLLE